MRPIIISLAFGLLVQNALAQGGSARVSARIAGLEARGVRFTPTALFAAEPRSAASDALWERACKRADVLRLDAGATGRLLRERPEHIAFRVPSAEGTVELRLERADITADGFQVVQASTGAPANYAPGLHYRGMVHGMPGSVAAISVFNGEVMGLISDADGERVLGKFEDDRAGMHVFYREQDLRASSGAACHMPDDTPDHSPAHVHGAETGDRTLRCVRLYWEVNYDIFLDKGNVTNATNYVTGLFNQSAVLYANDGIDVTLSEVFVWDVASPYTSTSTSTLLDQFGDERTSFNGDLAHLLGYAGGGGIAWLGTLCSSQTWLRMAYSGINSSYANVPTFSWSVEVVTHEQGHNMGSRHTHACVWNGNNTAIDGCGPAAGYNEGCTGPLPSSSVGGTIMSYCHLTSSTIKFVNGFGPQPQAVIVNAINSASCLTACGTSCDPPGGLTAINLTTTSATLSWAAIGASSYTLQWKPTSSGTWNTVSGLTDNFYALSGLTQNTSYDFHVLSVCGATSSAYSSTYTFTTPLPCPDAMEPNNSTAAAAALTLPASFSALIASGSDVDYYRLTLTATGTITISLSNLAGDYDVRLLNSAGTQLAISENGSTTSEFISYGNATAGTYYVHVFGFNGAFSATQCYALSVNATGQSCSAPSDLNTQNITYNSAGLSWNTVGGAVSYTLRWRVAPDGTWTTVTGLTTTPYTLSGLSPSTGYNFEVLTVCQGGSSQFSGTGSFTTAAAPCEVAPTAVVALKVFLDGAYRSAQGLMIDSLRAKGLLPLQEPYTALGYAPVGTLSTTAPVFAVTGNNAIVDWILVELRNATTPATVEETRVGLVQRDGDVVAMNGTSALGFCVTGGPYRIAVRHRNHLACMTGSAVTLGSSPTAVDLTLPGTSTYGTGARRTVGSVMALWSGNTFPNGMLSYTGTDNDRDLILQAVGGVVPTSSVSGYLPTDVNLDGRVKYTGADNDKDPILVNIGGVVPTNTLSQQLP